MWWRRSNLYVFPGLVVCMTILLLVQKIRKFVFKDPVTFIVALSSSEEVDRFQVPICSQQNSFYVSFFARKEKEATQSKRYSAPFRKAEKEVGDKGSWLQEFVTPKEVSTGRSKLQPRIVRACEGESQKALLILIKKPLQFMSISLAAKVDLFLSSKYCVIFLIKLSFKFLNFFFFFFSFLLSNEKKKSGSITFIPSWHFPICLFFLRPITFQVSSLTSEALGTVKIIAFH